MVKVTMNLPEEVYEALLEGARKNNLSPDEYFTRAVRHYIFKAEVEARGGKFLIEKRIPNPLARAFADKTYAYFWIQDPGQVSKPGMLTRFTWSVRNFWYFGRLHPAR